MLRSLVGSEMCIRDRAPNRLYKSEVRRSVSRVKTPCEHGLPHCTYVLQAEQQHPLGVRPTLPAARGSSQLAASAESLVTDAECNNGRVTCLLHIISDVTRVRHAQGTTLSILRAFIACATAVQTAVLVLSGPSCLGHYKPLQRRSASDKCSVRCMPIKQNCSEGKICDSLFLKKQKNF